MTLVSNGLLGLDTVAGEYSRPLGCATQASMSNTTLPVVGVPMASGPLVGIDAALSTMQMPPGIPVACMSIGKAGATNAAIYAAQILAVCDEQLGEALVRFKQQQAAKVGDKVDVLLVRKEDKRDVLFFLRKKLKE